MRWKILAGGILVLAGTVWAANTSLFSSFPGERPLRVIAHRGQHQLYERDGLGRDTCTASRMLPPTHPFIENTIPSMQAAFATGADVVELDVHLTPDRQFAVFHDWTLDCRTNGQGVTEQTTMGLMRTLDIGFGYTADEGQTFPFRGKGIGMMPTLPEVFETMPQGSFLINFKSRRAEEGDALAQLLRDRPAFRQSTFAVYGGDEPTRAAAASVAGLPGFTASGMKGCLLNYLKLGWSGHVPRQCRNTLVTVPANYAFLLWGWPERFYRRMQEAGSDVILMGPYEPGDVGTSGIDEPEDWDLVPEGFPGYVWTNRIENAAEELRRRGFCDGEPKPRPCTVGTASPGT